MLRIQQGYRVHQGALGLLQGVRGVGALVVITGIGGFRGCRGVRHALGAGRECRYSGASRGIGGIRGD